MATSKRPTNKVGAGALAGAISTIGVYAYEQISNTPLPGAIAAAVTVVVMFAVSYIVPESSTDEEPEPEEA